ncbi:HNH endonuclease [Arvimicrobium flavum]|uniref:HNH endonuclease signature motif containing protein n=1 Tax=Arvimicrobium flavum TaxID=3393320 RepID=UPI00237BAD5F|nr:HNH endonuclease [Mesorhizobium shangrilense]
MLSLDGAADAMKVVLLELGMSAFAAAEAIEKQLDGTPETNLRWIGLVVDHIFPHRGDEALFWDRSNWQPLCHDDHDIVKQREEHGRVTNGSDARGARWIPPTRGI